MIYLTPYWHRGDARPFRGRRATTAAFNVVQYYVIVRFGFLENC